MGCTALPTIVGPLLAFTGPKGPKFRDIYICEPQRMSGDSGLWHLLPCMMAWETIYSFVFLSSVK